jgi:hypothetical protein
MGPAWAAAWLVLGMAPAAANLSGAERDVAGQALAVLPAALRSEVELVRGSRPCPADVLSGVVITGRRIEVCAGGSLRRQVLFAAFSLLDEARGWSRQEGWRRLNGWSRSALPPWRWSPRNQAPGAYAAPAGQRSPALDLATFAAAWLDGETDLACRLLPQARFLQARLRELGTGVALPLSCPAFEAWSRRAQLDHIELTLATPSTVTMASMFGHVFLRLVERAPAGEPPALEDRTIAFLVETALPVTEEPFYAVKGIAGAYQASLVERSFLETYRTYVVAEGRDLRRFRLDLTPAETDALLERIWSLRQAGRYRYYFFATNCATLMVDLINDVLPPDRQVHYPEALATTPAGTLEGYAGTRAAGGGPLAVFIPGSILSFEHEARSAGEERARLATRLAADARFAETWRAIRTGDEAGRTAAYQDLATTMVPSADLQRFLRASAIVESHLSTLANLEAEEVAERQRRTRLHARLALIVGQVGGEAPCARASAAATGLATSDDLQTRLRGYRALLAAVNGPCRGDPAGADQLRRVALLGIAARHDGEAVELAVHDGLLFPEPERQLGQQRFAEGLAELIDHPYVTRVSPPLLALQRAERALAARAPLETPDRLRREEAAARGRAEASVYAGSVARTGIDELEVGGAIDRDGRPLLVLGGALHDEQIGDQRRFGFPPHTALTVGRTRTSLAWERGRPVLADWQARALGYRSLPPRLELGRWRPRVGGEVSLDLAGRSAGRPLALRLGGGGLIPLAASPRLTRHLLLGAGVVSGVDRGGGLPALACLGGSLALEGRLAFSRVAGAWLGARADLRPLWTTAGPARELIASADLRLPLVQATSLPGASVARALVLRLGGHLGSSTLPLAPGLDGRVGLALAVE